MIKKSLIALLLAYFFCVCFPVLLHRAFEDTSPPSDSYFTDSSFKMSLYAQLSLNVVLILLFLLRKKICKLLPLDDVILFHFTLYLFFYNVVGIVFSIQERNTHLVYNIVGARKIKDSLYGYIYPAKAQRHEIVYNEDTILFEATYTFDSLGRRATPPPKQHKSKSVLFFGCSFTYGDGVNNDETLPSQYAQLDTSVNVYNYAIDGWGPQQSMIQITQRNLSLETQSDTALGIYVWIDDHVKRASLFKSHYLGWTQYFPCFEMQNQQLTYQGNFEQVHPFKGIFFELLDHSIFFRNIEIPKQESEQDYLLTAEILRLSKEAFSKKIKSGKFIVFLYPGSSDKIVPYLIENKIEYVFGKKDELNNSDFIPKHGHPNKHANVKVARYLYQLINQRM